MLIPEQINKQGKAKLTTNYFLKKPRKAKSMTIPN